MIVACRAAFKTAFRLVKHCKDFFKMDYAVSIPMAYKIYTEKSMRFLKM